MSTCLDENAALALIEHALPPGERARYEAHLVVCGVCRRVMSELVRAMSVGTNRAEVMLGRGASFGRYLVLEPVGAGAMGAVYAAFDPELDRRVALKVLHAGGGEGALLVREARAMARLQHPNVVRVYDAGEDDGRFYLVMELVEGTSLGAHLRARLRPAREVLALFVKAGRGITAAHAAGLIHCDFKPDNVLVGLEGEVQVTDFGLARVAQGHPPGVAARRMLGEAEAVSAGSTLTAFAGTPAYMSPEQLRGERADAKSDQFSFCVALYEALYGARPFVGLSTGELLRAIERGPRRPTGAAGVPVRVWRAIERGLSLEPPRRHPNMAALLDALEHGRTRRVLASVATLAACAVPAVAYGAYRAHRAQLEATCMNEGAQIESVWGETRKGRVERAFAASGLPFSDDAARSVAAALDGYAAAWSQMARESCQATRVHGQQSPELHALRSHCLDERLGELDAFAARLEAPERRLDLVTRAARAARDLPAVARCADVTALLAPLREPAELSSRLVDAHKVLNEARALLLTGEFTAGVEMGRQALAAAEATGHAPLTAAALLTLGELETALRAPEAEGRLVNAFLTAEAVRDDRLKARAAERLVLVVGARGRRPEQGLDWARFAFAALARSGGDDALSAAIFHSVALVENARGSFDAAAAAFERASELSRRAGPLDLKGASLLWSLAGIRHNQGRYDEAIDLYNRALEPIVEALGPRAPQVGELVYELGAVYGQRGELDLARAHYERAHVLFHAVYGPTHENTLLALVSRWDLDALEDRAEATLPTVPDMLATAERSLGPSHNVTRTCYATAGHLYLAAGHLKEAQRLLERVIEAEHSTALADTYQATVAAARLAWVELALGHGARARARFELARQWASDLSIDAEARAEFLFVGALVYERADPTMACAYARDALVADNQMRATYRAVSPKALAARRDLDAWFAARPQTCPRSADALPAR